MYVQHITAPYNCCKLVFKLKSPTVTQSIRFDRIICAKYDIFWRTSIHIKRTRVSFSQCNILKLQPFEQLNVQLLERNNFWTCNCESLLHYLFSNSTDNTMTTSTYNTSILNRKCRSIGYNTVFFAKTKWNCLLTSYSITFKYQLFFYALSEHILIRCYDYDDIKKYAQV